MMLVATSPAIYADDSDDKQKDDTKTEVLSTITGDWNADKILDSAVLMRNKELVELYIYFNNKKSELTEVFYKKDVVWTGALEGTKPYLETNDAKTSLLIYSENTAIGRHRWSQILTVAYRNKNFLVGGYTHNSWDTIDLKTASKCDLNLFTGKGIKNEKDSFKVDAQKIKLKDWNSEFAPKACK